MFICVVVGVCDVGVCVDCVGVGVFGVVVCDMWCVDNCVVYVQCGVCVFTIVW